MITEQFNQKISWKHNLGFKTNPPLSLIHPINCNTYISIRLKNKQFYKVTWKKNKWYLLIYFNL